MLSTSPNDTMIRAATAEDAAAVADIYNHYVTETVVTFEEIPIAATEMVRRIEDVPSASLPWIDVGYWQRTHAVDLVQ